VATRGVADDDATAWTRGELVFDNEELTHVAAALRRWYGIELRMPAALRTRHVTATFRASESAPQVLSVLSAVLGAQVVMRGDTAVLSARSQ
jgi:ferric-dicitrate binding protein FerR (iron transport regulator)